MRNLIRLTYAAIHSDLGSRARAALAAAEAK